MILFTKYYIFEPDYYVQVAMYICATIYAVPGGSTKTNEQIAAGAISIFLSWMNFSLFLKAASSYGIYITMATRVFITVLRVCCENISWVKKV